jgi:hypothetical protein
MRPTLHTGAAEAGGDFRRAAQRAGREARAGHAGAVDRSAGSRCRRQDRTNGTRRAGGRAEFYDSDRRGRDRRGDACGRTDDAPADRARPRCPAECRHMDARRFGGEADRIPDDECGRRLERSPLNARRGCGASGGFPQRFKCTWPARHGLHGVAGRPRHREGRRVHRVGRVGGVRPRAGCPGRRRMRLADRTRRMRAMPCDPLARVRLHQRGGQCSEHKKRKEPTGEFHAGVFRPHHTSPTPPCQRVAVVSALLRNKAPSAAISSPACRPSRIW